MKSGVPNGAGQRSSEGQDRGETPAAVIWEVTRASDLACAECSAGPSPHRDVYEVWTLEAIRFMNDVRRLGRTRLVLTGRDPFKRTDLVDLVEHGARLGLRMELRASATPLATAEALGELRRVGLQTLAMRIDGRVPGRSAPGRDPVGPCERTLELQRTLELLGTARSLGLRTEIISRSSPSSLRTIVELAELVADLDPHVWHLVFPHRNCNADSPNRTTAAHRFEALLDRVYELASVGPFELRTTAGPQYNRVALQRGKGEWSDSDGRASRSEGEGSIFVDHRGGIRPSSLLPMSVGNVRTDDLADVYRDHPLLLSLRDPDRLDGKCGACEFKRVCGGSRARAYASTGDPLAEDPSCPYIPAGWSPS